MIRIASPDISEDDIDAVVRVLRSGQLVQGTHVAQFEQQLAPMTGVPHVVAVSNCTAALHLTLVALGVGRGDKVAVTTYSWPATANAIVLAGATPVFVDIDAAAFNMDPAALERTVLDHDVKAVLVVHAFGGMADMAKISAVAERAGAVVIEDAACALGASIGNRPAGAWGSAACFSFHPRKAITTGEGGAISTRDSKLAGCIRALRNHGQDPNVGSPDFVIPGYNLRMTEFQAALGSGQLRRWPTIIAARLAAARRYDDQLASLGFQLPASVEPGSHSYQSYVVLLPPEVAPLRGALIAALREDGIETTIGTYHIPLTSYYRTTYGFQAGDFPVTDAVAARALSLPLHSKLTPSDQERVVSSLALHMSHVSTNAH